MVRTVLFWLRQVELFCRGVGGVSRWSRESPRDWSSPIDRPDDQPTDRREGAPALPLVPFLSPGPGGVFFFGRACFAD